MIFIGNRESSFYRATEQTDAGLIGRIYSGETYEIPKPGPVEKTVDANAGKSDNKKGKAIEPKLETVNISPNINKRGVPSIFNRYELFYFDNFVDSPNGAGEPRFDSPDRLSGYIQTSRSTSFAEAVLKNPTAQNLINWSKNGKSVSIEYDWPDFLWCKNYGKVPNNYMITLRRFAVPASDDIFFKDKILVPDIGRMVTWVDGETNKWENAGLKFSTSLTWKKLESEIQSVNVGESSSWGGGEGKALEGAGGLMGAIGNAATVVSKILHPDKARAERQQGNRKAIDPYHDTMKVHGPIDIVKEMMIRDKGINFEQQFTLTFEYELRSIDGINTKIAFMDLIANIMMIVTNKAKWWGGEIKYWGNKSYRNVAPLGDPKKLEDGKWGEYLDSIMQNVTSGLKNIFGGKNPMSKDGVLNALSSIGGTLLDGIVGGGLDKMGRPEAIAVNSLLSGEDTGNWHVMVGNPANPIISVGNLIMEKADIEIDGPLGPDDFPNKIKVICSLKPARPRAREGIIDMFHRNGRIYTTNDPTEVTKIKKLVKRTSTTSADPLGLPKGAKPNMDDSRVVLANASSDPYADVPDLFKDRFANWHNMNVDKSTAKELIISNTEGIF